MKKTLILLAATALVGVGAAAVNFGSGVAAFAEPVSAEESSVEEVDVGSVFHFTNNKNWAEVYCYAFTGEGETKNAAWPGQKMTWEYNNKEGEGVYHIDLDAAYETVVFNNGILNEGKQQSQNITIGENAAWYLDDEYNGVPWEFEDYTRTFYLYLNHDTITSNELKVHAWNNNDNAHPFAEWPGLAMTKVDGNIYQTPEIPCYYNSLIFNSDSDSEIQQTGEIKDVCGYSGMAYNLFGSNWISLKQAKTQQWVDTYLHMDNDTEGQCVTLFPIAKENINVEIYSELAENDVFADAFARYKAWGTALGQNYVPGEAEASKLVAGQLNSRGTIALVVTLTSVAAIAVVGGMLYYISRKQKADRR